MFSACGSSQPVGERTIVSTNSTDGSGPPASEIESNETSRSNGQNTDSAPETPGPKDVKERIIQDGRTAAKLLVRVACEDPSEQGVLATIYALRVGIAPSPSCEEKALLRGTSSSSVLVRALSWRQLVQKTAIVLPAWSDGENEDPAVRILAALAHLTRNLPLPADLVSALSLPTGSPAQTDKKADVDNRIKQLAAAALPFDDGLLAAVVGFAESVYEESSELSDNRPIWSAERLRKFILDRLNIGVEQIPTSAQETPPPRARPTAAGELLENRLAHHPERMLDSMALSAPAALRIQALRAVVIRTGRPSPNVLAVAAAALQSDDTAVQIEGARTFLLLVRRIGRAR